MYEIGCTLEDCKAIYENTIRFKKNDKVSYFDRHNKKWEMGFVKNVSWKKINSKSVFVNEVETEKEKKIILAETKELIPYFPKFAEVNEVIKLPMYNRYTKEDGRRTYLEFPKVISFGTWCTCSQVITEVLLQARHYMSLYTQSRKTLSRQFVSISIKKDAFVQQEDNRTVGLPFEIILMETDPEQCAICSSKQFAGDMPSKKKCLGCKIPDKNIPMRSIVKYFGRIAICLDWNNISQYGLPEETEDINIKSLDNQENKVPTLNNCLKLLFKPVNEQLIKIGESGGI